MDDAEYKEHAVDSEFAADYEGAEHALKCQADHQGKESETHGSLTANYLGYVYKYDRALRRLKDHNETAKRN